MLEDTTDYNKINKAVELIHLGKHSAEKIASKTGLSLDKIDELIILLGFPLHIHFK